MPVLTLKGRSPVWILSCRSIWLFFLNVLGQNLQVWLTEIPLVPAIKDCIVRALYMNACCHGFWNSRLCLLDPAFFITLLIMACFFLCWLSAILEGKVLLQWRHLKVEAGVLGSQSPNREGSPLDNTAWTSFKSSDSRIGGLVSSSKLSFLTWK